ARICISSRPYAWRATEDGAFIKAALPYAAATATDEPGADEPSPSEDDDDLDLWVDDDDRKDEGDDGAALSLYRLAPLDETAIRLFAGHRGVMDVAGLLAEIERARLDDYAQRPFD